MLEPKLGHPCHGLVDKAKTKVYIEIVESFVHQGLVKKKDLVAATITTTTIFEANEYVK